jgi:hypothetical protein
MYVTKTAIMGRTCEEVMIIGSDNPMVLHCIIHLGTICCKTFFIGDEVNFIGCDFNCEILSTKWLNSLKFQHFP